MSSLLQHFQSSAALSGANAAFIEDLYEAFLADPDSVPEDWRRRFEQFAQAANQPETPHGPLRENLKRAVFERRKTAHDGGLSAAAAAKQTAVLQLINAYRSRGHQNAALDPLSLHEVPQLDELTLSYHKLDDDLDNIFNTGSLFAPERMKLRDILSLLQDVYTRTVGSEYMHITDTHEKRWIQQRLESYRARPELTDDDRRWIIRLLTAAEGLEKYLHTRYVGQKRFSLEGGEALIPLLDELSQRAGSRGMKKVVIGMAHRGRLNVLANILGKPPAEIFEEFEGKPRHHPLMTSGDVKYHMGFSSDIETPSGILHLALGFNPSHLEIIGPVVAGSVRARQQQDNDHAGDKVMPVLIHGDAAFAGQGVVMEYLNMSQTRGFSIGGTVHIVANNQIGFTTSYPFDSRSTNYCTDVGKMVQAPIFHVNGDDPEAVIFVTRLAMDYRNHFHKDVIIDLVCYRRHGHNEADEPSVTQPLMYQRIRQHPTVRAIYAETLLANGIIEANLPQSLVDEARDELDQGHPLGRPPICNIDHARRARWARFHNVTWEQPADTSITEKQLHRCSEVLVTLPEGFEPHPRVERIIDERRQMASGSLLSDWGYAENLAYATLLDEGYSIRMSGQDSRRGTFFHRHATLHDQKTGNTYTPLQHLSPGQPNFVCIDSLLSEEAVLAFEYGYSISEPNELTIWEAQFGDFGNGAQVVIDQFIASAGAKWGLYSGLVLFLPHGYEGQGPEHSSARIERYMQLCAEHNMQVCIPTTPAQIFHLLRRQMMRPYRRPLVVMTPKSLLRHPLATSNLESLLDGGFMNVLDEVDAIDPEKVKRLIICTGKVYYDLLLARRAQNREDVAIIRIEQLYPFPKADFVTVAQRYQKAESVIWCQEEPQNQGAWDQVKHRFHVLENLAKHIHYVGRPAAAAPATGFYQVHKAEQEKLVDDAINGHITPSMNTRSTL